MKTNLLICILKCINCIKIYNTYKIGGLKVVDFPIFYMWSHKGESLLKIIHIIVVIYFISISILISIMNIILNSF